MLTLSHSYLRTTSLDNLEDEEGEEEEKENLGKEEKKKEEKVFQQNESVKNIEELKEPYEFNEDMQRIIEEGLRAQFDSVLLEANKGGQFELDNECDETIEYKLDSENLQESNKKNILKEYEQEKSKKTEEGNGTKLDSKMEVESKFQQQLYENVQEKQQMLKNNLKLEIDKSVQISSTFHKDAEEKVEGIHKENQQTSKECIEVEVNIEMQVDSEFQHEPDKNKQEEFDSNQQLSDGDIEIELDIEVLNNTEFQHRLNESVQKDFNCLEQPMSDKNEEIKMEVNNSEFLQVVDENMLHKSDREIQKHFLEKGTDLVGDIQQTLNNKLLNSFVSEKHSYLEGNTLNTFNTSNMLHKISKRKIQLESDENDECYRNKQGIQLKLGNREVLINSEIQKLPGKVLDEFGNKQLINDNVQQQFCKEILNKRNGEIFIEFDEKKYQCNKDVQVLSNTQQKFLEKVQDEHQDKFLMKNEDMMQGNEFNKEILQNVYKQKHNVGQKLNKNVESKTEIELKESARQKQSKNQDNVQNTINEQLENIVNKSTQEDNNLQLKSQEIIEDSIEEIPKQDIEGVELKLNEFNFGKEMNQVLSDVSLTVFANKEFELQMEIERTKQKNIIEKFLIELHQNIKSLTNEVFDNKQIDDEVFQYGVNGEICEQIMQQIRQEIEELQREVEEFDIDQDEKLENKFADRVHKTYSYLFQNNFFEKLLHSLLEEASPFYDKVKNIHNLFFPTLHQKLDNKLPIELDKVTQQKLNDKVLNKLANIFQSEVNKTVQGAAIQQSNNETHLLANSDASIIPNKNIQLELCSQSESAKNKIQCNLIGQNNEEADKKYADIPQENIEDRTDEKMFKDFDIVLQFNREDQYKKDFKAHQMVKGNVLVEFNKDIINDSKEKVKQHFRKTNYKSNEPESFGTVQNIFVHQDSGSINKQISHMFNKIISQQFSGEIKQSDKDDLKIEFYEEKLQEDVEEMEVDLDEETPTNIKKLKQNCDKKIYLELEFYHQARVGERFQENNVLSVKDLEHFKRELLNNSEEQLEFDERIMDGDQQKLEEKIQEKLLKQFGPYRSEEKFKEILEESDVKIKDQFHENVERDSVEKIQEELSVDIEATGDKKHNFIDDTQVSHYESDVDVVEFENLLLDESDVDIESFEEVLGKDNLFQQKINKKLLEDIDEELIPESNETSQQFLKPTFYKEINEVVELVEELDIESTSSINSSTQEHLSIDKSFSEDSSSSKEEYLSSDECSFSKKVDSEKNSLLDDSSSSDESLSSEGSSSSDVLSSSDESLFLGKLKLKKCLSSDLELSSSEEEFDKDEFYSTDEEKSSSVDGKAEINTPLPKKSTKKHQTRLNTYKSETLQQFENTPRPFEGKWSKVKEKCQQKFEDLQFKMGIENIQDLDEIPLELKIQQEQFEEDLHQQFKEFQSEFYNDLKLEHDKDLKLKSDYGFSPVSSQDFDKQQQTFYELKDDFHEIKDEYKGYVQQKMFEALQQHMDEKTLLEMETFPDKLSNVVNVIDEDVHKEFVELQRDCFELEPEFEYNVPIESEEDNFTQLLKPKPFNLFKKLQSIHKKKLCEFVDSDQWPENVS